jgi:pimeloyl-ACP methyl ester carboxylesterase
MTSAPVTVAIDRRTTVGSLSLAVTEYGTGGPPLLLLHGIGSRGVSWWPVVDALAGHFTLIVPDLRGHGDSDKPVSGYLPHHYAADLNALLDALDLARPAIVGHSLGGVVAMSWAQGHPDRATRIVLEDVALRIDTRSAPLFDEWMALAGLPVDDVAASYRNRYPDWSDEDCRRRAVSITSTAPAVFAEMRDRAIAESGADLIAPLAAIRTPVLHIRGDRETGGMVDPADAARFATTVPNARLAHIPGGSHSLHRDQTAAFLSAVVPFFLGAGDAGPR